ncbi:hypothetical protein ACROYT_G037891 [Oculina patagonica]
MKLKFPLLGLCINACLLLVFVGRSDGGVANLCEQGKFFDRSKQEYLPCSECKSEVQDCFSCCQSETEVQGEGGNTKNVSTLTTHPQAVDSPGAKKEKPVPSKDETSLPNILVVSIIGVFIVASLVVLLLIVIRAFLGRIVEAHEDTSDSQRSAVVTEVMMVEVKHEATAQTNAGDMTTAIDNATNSAQSIQI